MKKVFTFLAFLCTLQASAQLPDYVPASGLIGYWPMHSNLIDSSANTYDGTGSLFTYTYDRNGILSNACNLGSAAASYIRMSSLPLNTKNDYTLNCWMNLKIYNEGDVLADLHPDDVCGSYPQVWEEDDSLWIGTCDRSITSKSLGYKADYTNFWRMMTFVVKSDTTKVYRNGSLLLKMPSAWGVSTLANLVLGNIYNATETYTRGAGVMMDDIGLWGRLLDSCEIGNLYKASLLRFDTQPVDQTGLAGAAVSFSVASARSGVGYQWQSNLGAGGAFLDLSNSGQYSGVYTNTLNVSVLVAANDGQRFRCILTDSTSKCRVTSDEAECHVDPLSFNEQFPAGGSYLHQNMPNPSDGNTTISYSVPSWQQQAAIVIYDITGRQLRMELIREKGKGALEIHKGELPGGMYLYTLIVDGQKVDTRRMQISF